MTVLPFSRPPEIDRRVGAALRAARIERDLEPAATAAACGVPVEALRAYETGRRRVGAATLSRFCRVLGLHPSRLYREDG